MAGDSRSAFSGLEEGSELIFVVEHIDGKLGEPVRFGLHPSDLAGPAGVLFSEFRADSRKHRHGPGIDLKLLLTCITNLRQMALVGFSRQSAGLGFKLVNPRNASQDACQRQRRIPLFKSLFQFAYICENGENLETAETSNERINSPLRRSLKLLPRLRREQRVFKPPYSKGKETIITFVI